MGLPAAQPIEGEVIERSHPTKREAFAKMGWVDRFKGRHILSDPYGESREVLSDDFVCLRVSLGHRPEHAKHLPRALHLWRPEPHLIGHEGKDPRFVDRKEKVDLSPERFDHDLYIPDITFYDARVQPAALLREPERIGKVVKGDDGFDSVRLQGLEQRPIVREGPPR